LNLGIFSGPSKRASRSKCIGQVSRGISVVTGLSSSVAATLFLGVALAIAALPLCSSGAFCANKIKTWELLSEDSTVGRYKASIAYDQARLDTGYFVFLIRSSDLKHMYIMNPENAAYVKEPIEFFDTGKKYHPHFDKGKFIDTQVIAGIKCSHYLCSSNTPMLHADYWATTEFKLKPEMIKGYCHFTGAPIGYGTPIKLVEKLEIPGHIPRYFTRISVLKAKRLERENQFFQIPTNYKLVPDQVALISSDNGKLDPDGIFFHSQSSETLKLWPSP
jgi:hypothetical protein